MQCPQKFGKRAYDHSHVVLVEVVIFKDHAPKLRQTNVIILSDFDNRGFKSDQLVNLSETRKLLGANSSKLQLRALLWQPKRARHHFRDRIWIHTPPICLVVLAFDSHEKLQSIVDCSYF